MYSHGFLNVSLNVVSHIPQYRVLRNKVISIHAAGYGLCHSFLGRSGLKTHTHTHSLNRQSQCEELGLRQHVYLDSFPLCVFRL